MKKGPKKILVIDDDPGICRMLEKRLKASHGYDVVYALDARTGMAKAKSEKPDCIILDVMIPDMSGGEVAKVLHEDPATKDIPIVFLTVLLEQKGKKHIELEGKVYRAIAKPYYQPELLSALRKAMNQKDGEA